MHLSAITWTISGVSQQISVCVLGGRGGVEVENVQHFTLLTGLSSHRQIVKAEEKKTYDVKTTPVIGARAS